MLTEWLGLILTVWCSNPVGAATMLGSSLYVERETATSLSACVADAYADGYATTPAKRRFVTEMLATYRRKDIEKSRRASVVLHRWHIEQDDGNPQ